MTSRIQRDEPPDVYPSHPILRPGDMAMSPQLGQQPSLWTLHFNEVSSMLAANRPYYKGIFTEDLTDVERAALLPSVDLTCSGYAMFDNYGNLLEVVMQAATAVPESPVTIALADYYFGFDYVLSGGETVSVCNGLEYRAYK